MSTIPQAGTRRSVRAIPLIVAMLVLGLLAALLAQSPTKAQAAPVTPVTSPVIAERSVQVVPETSSATADSSTATATSKKKADPNDPGYWKDANNACTGYKIYKIGGEKQIFRLKRDGKTYGWLMAYRNSKNWCIVNLAAVRNNGDSIFRMVSISYDGKVKKRDSGKFKVLAGPIKVSRESVPSPTLYASTHVGGTGEKEIFATFEVTIA